ncbi:MAG: succinate dehydrogenase, cytochrome b556 subunit [Betaproteobacteria bacterium]
MAKLRPKYLNLFEIKLPIPGIVSILHRVSGAGLFLMLPFLLYLLQSSLQSPSSYILFRDLLSSVLVKLLLLGLLWAFLHHFAAGIRYLLLDIHVGTALAPARASSFAVIGASLVLTVLFGVWMW